MNRRPQDDLLRDTFADGELDALREATLARGLVTQRSKRRLRSARNTTLTVVPVLLLLVAAFCWRTSTAPTPGISSSKIASIPPLKIYPAATVADAPPIPTISDKELLALYAYRSVGLLGKPGQQKLVFFDAPVKSVN